MLWDWSQRTRDLSPSTLAVVRSPSRTHVASQTKRSVPSPHPSLASRRLLHTAMPLRAACAHRVHLATSQNKRFAFIFLSVLSFFLSLSLSLFFYSLLSLFSLFSSSMNTVLYSMHCTVRVAPYCSMLNFYLTCSLPATCKIAKMYCFLLLAVTAS